MFHSAFKKFTWKGLLLEVKGLIQIIIRFRAEKVLCMFLSPNILLRGIKYWLRKQLCSFEKERLISYSYTIWFMISEKKNSQGACFVTVVHACTRSLSEACRKCGLVIFICEHGYILIEGGRSFKTFLKKNMQLLWKVLKNVNHGLEDYIDRT